MVDVDVKPGAPGRSSFEAKPSGTKLMGRAEREAAKSFDKNLWTRAVILNFICFEGLSVVAGNTSLPISNTVIGAQRSAQSAVGHSRAAIFDSELGATDKYLGAVILFNPRALFGMLCPQASKLGGEEKLSVFRHGGDDSGSSAIR